MTSGVFDTAVDPDLWQQQQAAKIRADFLNDNPVFKYADINGAFNSFSDGTNPAADKARAGRTLIENLGALPFQSAPQSLFNGVGREVSQLTSGVKNIPYGLFFVTVAMAALYEVLSHKARA